MRDIHSILTELRRPFKPSYVDWKVQSANDDRKSALVVAFVDARDVSERLNQVCPGQWSNRHKELIINNSLEGVTCTLTLADDEHAVTVEDVGIGDPITEGMPNYQRDIVIKTYWSDAFKRAGVKLGIASSLYELPTIWLNEEHLYIPADKVKGINKEGKSSLTERYEKWVTSDLIRNRFGEVYEW